MPAKLDLKTQVFGDLTVLCEQGRKSGSIAWLCQCVCGNQAIVSTPQLRTGGTKSCGCLRRKTTARLHSGPNQHNWTGGRYVHRGYVFIRPNLAKELYPNAVFKHSSRSVLEHQIVMSDALGRALLVTESVHHKNGVKADNRIENLELRTRYHGPGQEASDLVTWAKELLRQYEPEALR